MAPGRRGLRRRRGRPRCSGASTSTCTRARASTSTPPSSRSPRGRRGVRLPEGVLVCNFPRPAPAAPALMEHGDVKTFFHEFGHLLHHVLGGHTRWAAQSGRRDRVGLRRGAVADARGVGLGSRRARHASPATSRPGEPIPADAGAADEGGRRVRQGPHGAAADVLRRDEPRAAPRATRRPRHDRARRASCRSATRRSATWRGPTSTSRSATSTATRPSTTRTCGRS